MDKKQLKELLQKLLDSMLESLEQCEPELKCAYVSTILELTDRMYALDRKLDL